VWYVSQYIVGRTEVNKYLSILVVPLDIPFLSFIQGVFK
jgi:hypothetical protein